MGWRLIAGLGELGDLNWCATFDNDEKRLEPQLRRLRRHYGERVLLTGGGGSGAHLATLVAARIVKERGRNGEPWVALQVDLKRVKPPLCGRSTFSPYINSWQISVRVWR